MTIISINRQKVNQDGENAILIWNDKREVIGTARSLEILGPSILRHDPKNKLPNGTQLWIETDAELNIRPPIKRRNK